jgi:hypothetical protein
MKGPELIKSVHFLFDLLFVNDIAHLICVCVIYDLNSEQKKNLNGRELLR